MDVKINGGLVQPLQPQKKPAANAPQGASFAENLKTATAFKTGASAQTPEAVFEQALSDRSNPDFQQIDALLEGLIQEEMKKGGGF